MKIKLGIVGLGTVGTGVVKIIEKNRSVYKKEYGIEIIITGISAKNKKKKRSFNIENYCWYDNPLKMASSEEVDIVVELIGGTKGLPLNLAKCSLKNKKHFVTANKAMIATYGNSLINLANKNGVNLNFEASVAGGIPIIRLIQNSLLSGKITSIYGILNGTCNYILTQMREHKVSFSEALFKAQKLGFAESDPYDDISGMDTAYKLSILSNLTYGVKSMVKNIYIEGISDIQKIDLNMADKLNYTILLLGISNYKNQNVLQRVHPCLVSKNSMLTKVSNEINTVVLEDNHAGKILIVGKGAGEIPTASAVVTDILNFNETKKKNIYTNSKNKAIIAQTGRLGDRKGKFYIRILAQDKPGVLADITSFFKRLQVSIKIMFQLEERIKSMVPLIFVTHSVSESQINLAINKIRKLKKVERKITIIRIEDV